jgi:hypothetical protein
MNNSMVIIMEKEFESVRKLLLEYTKLHVQSLIILNICNVIICLCALGNIPLLITTSILLNTFLRNTLKAIHKECNLKQVGKIMFGENGNYDIYDIKITDVYNTTRTLSSMKGKVEQSIHILRSFNKFYIITASISLVWGILVIIITMLNLR